MPNTTAPWPFTNRLTVELAAALALLVIHPAWAANYFVSENGNDDARGDSINAPWRTIERVNHHRLHATDRILFEAGQSFNGNLRFRQGEAEALDGPGLMVYTYPYASYADRDNIVRFNISENDSRKSKHYAGLWLRTDGRAMTGVEIYNNTILAAAEGQRRQSLMAFRPLPRSPALAGGLDLRSRFGLDVGSSDFLGQPLPAAGPFPLGAIRAQTLP